VSGETRGWVRRVAPRMHRSERMDPLTGSSWSTPATVAGFVRSPPNETLLQFAGAERTRIDSDAPIALDVGCGAGRNAVPLAEAGWHVLGTDLSWPMLAAAHERRGAVTAPGRLHLVLAPMHQLPVASGTCDLVVAHGIWNLARSSAEFRSGVREAGRVAAPGAALFVFTFSRHTLAVDAEPVDGEAFVFTSFSGQPQCFLTRQQLLSELQEAGFTPDPRVPLRELNRPRAGMLTAARAPVIYEGAFRRV
jgi:SAM-dependent methyltransferase